MSRGLGKLRIVPFDPSDYSLGGALHVPADGNTTDVNSISAILSLYFQWQERAKCAVTLSGAICAATMTFDEDEREPSELYITLKDENALNSIKEINKNITIYFEVFKTAFEMNATILDVSENIIVILPPTEIKTYKRRGLPRIYVGDLTDSKGLNIRWVSNSVTGTFRVQEIGLKSILIKTETNLPNEDGILFWENTSLKAKCVRSEKQQAVLTFQFQTGEEAGAFFDLYRKFAYPQLKPRHEFDANLGFELYFRSGYFGKFTNDATLGNIKDELVKTWNTIAPGFHSTTADFFATDSSGNPIGASSVTLAFERNDKPLWIFHQLCAITDPAYIRASGQLYTWRAEYLACRPDEVVAAVTFDSRSRWLERIYVKYANQEPEHVKFVAIRREMFKFRNTPEKVEGSIPIQTRTLGETKRFLASSKEYFMGYAPKRLNAAGILDTIIVINNQFSLKLLNLVGHSLANETGKEEVILEVMFPNSFNTSDWGGEPLHHTDRYCEFEQISLMSFFSSVEHSIAVTERKLADSET